MAALLLIDDHPLVEVALEAACLNALFHYSSTPPVTKPRASCCNSIILT